MFVLIIIKPLLQGISPQNYLGNYFVLLSKEQKKWVSQRQWEAATALVCNCHEGKLEIPCLSQQLS